MAKAKQTEGKKRGRKASGLHGAGSGAGRNGACSAAQTFRAKRLGEPLAQYLHDMADLFGADRDQRRLLAEAAAMSFPERSDKDRATARMMAHRIGQELQSGIRAVVAQAQARGEAVAEFNDAGAVVIKGRDGLYSLMSANPPALTEPLFNTAIAYRALVECCGYTDVGSQLGKLTGQPGCPRTSTKSIHRARLNSVYAGYQLAAAEVAVGRELLPILRAVAGEGQTIRSLTTGGRRRKKLVEDLVKALEIVRASLAETGGLRIRGH